MSTTLEEIQKQALELDRRSRASLAARLLQSLEAGEDAEIERAWILEAKRRLAEILDGRVRPKTACSVLRRAREQVAPRIKSRANRQPARSRSIR